MQKIFRCGNNTHSHTHTTLNKDFTICIQFMFFSQDFPLNYNSCILTEYIILYLWPFLKIIIFPSTSSNGGYLILPLQANIHATAFLNLQNTYTIQFMYVRNMSVSSTSLTFHTKPTETVTGSFSRQSKTYARVHSQTLPLYVLKSLLSMGADSWSHGVTVPSWLG